MKCYLERVSTLHVVYSESPSADLYIGNRAKTLLHIAYQVQGTGGQRAVLVWRISDRCNRAPFRAISLVSTADITVFDPGAMH